VRGIDAAEVQRRLAQRHINVTVSQTEGTLLDMEERGLEAIVRASVHYYNSEEEIELFCEALASQF
jgi:selenocysteine lyase/cysteine desulfurase